MSVQTPKRAAEQTFLLVKTEFARAQARWTVLGALFVITVLNYVDRQALSILAPRIQMDLHVSDLVYGHIVTAFLAAYTLSYLLAGPLSDRLGSRRSLAVFAGWWSIAEVLPALVRSSLGLGGSRFLLGLGEAGNYVAAPKAIRQWFVPSERGIAIGIYTAGATVGASIAAPLVVLLANRFGWRSVFVVTGGAGLVWLLPWWFATRDHPSPAAAVATRDSWTVAFRRVLGEQDTWLLMACRFLTDPVLYFFLFWFPKYFTETNGPLHGRATSLWVLYLCGDAGAILSGLVAAHFIRRGVDRQTVRRWMLVSFAALMPCVAGFPAIHRTGYALALAAFVLAVHMAWLVMLTNIVVDRYPEETVGTASGVIASGSGLGGLLSAELIANNLQQHGYAPVFVFLALLHPVALLLVFRLRRIV